MDKDELGNYYNKSIRSLKINKAFIKLLVAYYKKDYQLDSYLNKIIFKNKIDDYFIAVYNEKSKNIYINIDELVNIICSSYKINIDNLSIEQNQIIYDEIIFKILHEIVHSIQKKWLTEWNDENSLPTNLYLIKDCISLINDNYDLYKKSHDIFTIEHHAEGLAGIIRNDFVYQYGKEDIKRCNKLDAYNLIKDYSIVDSKIISSTRKMYDIFGYYKFSYYELPDSKSNKNIDNLLYGLPVDLATFLDVKNVSQGKKRIINIKEYIKAIK